MKIDKINNISLVKQQFRAICSIPDLIKDMVKDILCDKKHIDIFVSPHRRGNTQHRLNGSISVEEHNKIIFESDEIIKNLY